MIYRVWYAIIKCINLSIKLGFISRLYIVKSRRGILFNKISPTSPARAQIKIDLCTPHWVHEWFYSNAAMNCSIFNQLPLCCLSRSLPRCARPQFSTNKLKVRCSCRNRLFSLIWIDLTSIETPLQHPSQPIKRLLSLFIPVHQEQPAPDCLAWKGQYSFCLQTPEAIKIIVI